MLKKLQRLTTSSRTDQKKVINEALEMALQEIDKEPNNNNNNINNIKSNNKNTATNNLSYNKNNKTNNKNNNNNNNNNKSKEQQQQHKDTYHISNKTDEEKEFKVKYQQKQHQQQQQQKQQLPNNVDIKKHEKVSEEEKMQEDEEEQEVRISKEPIYENVSTASMQQVDVDATKKIITNISSQIIIPQKNNRQIFNDENNKENIIKIINNQNNNEKLINENSNNNNNPNKNPKLSSLNSTNYNHNNNNNNSNNIDIRNATTTTTTCIEQQKQPHEEQVTETIEINEPFYQVPKSIIMHEPYYDAPKNVRPVPVYENIDVFYNGVNINSIINNISNNNNSSINMEPPKEKPPPPPIESPPPFDETDCMENGDAWSSENTYETISARLPTSAHQRGLMSVAEHPSPPIKRMNSTKRIKKELRNKRSSFLGIEGSVDDDETFLEFSLVPPPDMAQLLQEERRLEKQLYLKAAGLCDSSDTGESRDSGVSENHSRQSSEHYTNSSEENDHPRLIESPPLKATDMMYQNDALTAAQTPLLQTVKGDCAEAWTESATVAAAATKSLTEATATANAKMLCIEEKIREQEEVLRVERELLQLEQEELKRQRENLMLRENMARRELQHGAKMLMSANRHSLQDLNAGTAYAHNASLQHIQPIVVVPKLQQQQQQQSLMQYQQVQEKMPQQIYANLPNNKQISQVPQAIAPAFYQQVQADYRKSMSDINEFTKRSSLPPIPPTKPLRAMHVPPTGHFSNSLVKIAKPTAAPRAANIYSNYGNHHQSVQNLPQLSNNAATIGGNSMQYGNMTRNTLHALSATPKPKYTDGWVQIQQQQQQNYQQKRKSLPENAFQQSAASYNNHWLVQEAEHRRITAEQRRSSVGSHLINGSGSKPLPDSIIQTLTERVQSKGIGERKRLEKMGSNNNSSGSSNSGNNNKCHLQQQSIYATNGYGNNNSDVKTSPQKSNPTTTTTSASNNSNNSSPKKNAITLQTSPTPPQEKMLSVSGKKKCSHCGEELGRGAAMIIESLLLFYHINCFKCCVCHVQLGDGLNGTDVRVRNNKLHCQNCYSSDDGIKFSCV